MSCKRYDMDNTIKNIKNMMGKQTELAIRKLLIGNADFKAKVVSPAALFIAGVPYFAFHKSDMKDIFIRSHIWKVNKRPETIPHNDPTRQSNFRGGKE